MVSMAWSEAYSVGSAMLDSDHRILIELLNQLQDATETGQSRQVVGSVLNVLAEYAEHHFRREEAVMAQIGYLGRADHERQHRALEARVTAIRECWQAGKHQALGEEVLTFLKKWLTEHILAADKAYRPWIEASAGNGGPVEDAAGGGA